MNIKKTLLLIAGFTSLSIGAIGIFLPILPTTPFVLLASGCFAGSSPRFYKWLAESKAFGGYIRHYQTKSGVSQKDKTRALIFLWCALILSAVVFRRPMLWIILSIVGVAVSTHILLLKKQTEEKN